MFSSFNFLEISKYEKLVLSIVLCNIEKGNEQSFGKANKISYCFVHILKETFSACLLPNKNRDF